MKTKFVRFGQGCWQVFTEVPGWPDAPRAVRLRRALPILIPCAIMLLLWAWNSLVRDPARQQERARHEALVTQDREIDALKVVYSDHQTAEIAARADHAAHLVVNDPAELVPVFQGLKQAAAERRWEGTFQVSDLSAGTPSADGQLVYVPARAKLVAGPGDAEAFSSLLALFERFSTAEKRIDLTRVGIRADEQGRYAAELNLRLVFRSANEKPPQ